MAKRVSATRKRNKTELTAHELLKELRKNRIPGRDKVSTKVEYKRLLDQYNINYKLEK